MEAMKEQYEDPDINKMDLVSKLEQAHLETKRCEDQSQALMFQVDQYLAQLNLDMQDRANAKRWNKMREEKGNSALDHLNAELKAQLNKCQSAHDRENEKFQKEIQKMLDAFKAEYVEKCTKEKADMTTEFDTKFAAEQEKCKGEKADMTKEADEKFAAEQEKCKTEKADMTKAGEKAAQEAADAHASEKADLEKAH